MTYVTRKQRHRRLSHLFTIDAHIPKLDVTGSSPVSRSKDFKSLPCAPVRRYDNTSQKWNSRSRRCGASNTALAHLNLAKLNLGEPTATSHQDAHCSRFSSLRMARFSTAGFACRYSFS
jgi:hypothetical protein